MSKRRSGFESAKRIGAKQGRRPRDKLLRSGDPDEQQGVHQELRECEERYRSLVEAAPDVIFTVSAEDRLLTSVNPEFETLTGWSRTDWLGKPLAGIIHPDDSPGALEALEKVFRGEKQSLAECRLLCKSGGYLVGEFILTPQVKDGRITGGLGIGHDITARKRTEEALKKSTQLLKDAGEMAKVGGWELDLSTKGVSGTEEVCRIYGGGTGYNPKLEEAMNFFAPESRPALEEALKNAAETGEPWDLESLFTPSGSNDNIWVRSLGRAVYSGGKIGKLTGTFQDIDKYKRVEEALGESETRFREVFENGAIGIALVDAHGHPLESNPALRTMLGYENFELMDMAFTEFTHPHDARADWDLFMELVEGKRDHYQMEKRFLRKNGQVMWGKLTVSLIRNQRGEFKYCIGMVEDTSGRKRAEEALRQQSGRLLRLQDEERRRIARELHETTAQSLAGLAINLSIVKVSAADLSSRANACLSESLDLAEQCSREIRTLSYLLHPPLVDEAGLAPALGSYTTGFAKRSGIEVHFEVSPDFGRLPSEHELALYRIVQEALTNIHRHSGSNTARVRLERLPNEVVLTVADEGHGFPSAALGATGPESAAIGVGLPGMRERLRQLGGRLHIQTGSRGTTLTAILPLEEVNDG